LDPGILRGLPFSEIPRAAEPPEAAGAFEDLFAGYLREARADTKTEESEDRPAEEDSEVSPGALVTETGGAASLGVSYDAETGAKSISQADDEAGITALDGSSGVAVIAVAGGAQFPGGETVSGPAPLPSEGPEPESASESPPEGAAPPGTGGRAAGLAESPNPEAPGLPPESEARRDPADNKTPVRAGKTADRASDTGPSPASSGVSAKAGAPAETETPPEGAAPGPEALAAEAPAGVENRRSPERDAEQIPLRKVPQEFSREAERIHLRAGDRENEGTEKSGENHRNGRRRTLVELRDYRARPLQEAAASGPPPHPASPESAGTELHPESFSQDTVLVDLTAAPGERENRAGGTGTFEEILARELRQTLNGDIVRHAQVILRDGGEGIIRLSLKPESLGNVKIRLELTENKIAGRVIVESGEALRAFEREMASLEQAFRDSGYESADLGAFLAQDGQGSGGEGPRDQPFYSSRFAEDRAASRYDEALEKIYPSGLEDSGPGFRPGIGSINMLV
jgi:hypothetical protein